MKKVSHRQVWIFAILLSLVPSVAFATDGATGNNLITAIDKLFALVANAIFSVLFFEIIPGFPLIVLWLIVAALFFTIRMGFVNIRMFKHAVEIVQGKHDTEGAAGELTHFQALAAALSATVGLGNIAGVAVAIMLGGPGATFWMTIGGFLGMTSKFVECTLGQKYRVVRPDGSVAGGAMYYLSRGLREIGLEPIGKILAGIFALFCIFGAYGGANLFQANQSYGAVQKVFPFLPAWLYGVILAVLVGVVIIGGIRRIGNVADKLVPIMCILYVIAALWILLVNFTRIPSAVGTIITEAFTPRAAITGGIITVIVQGFRRSAFSNEAGIGSAAIAHSAARTDKPIKEGLVALLEPFIDTIVICNMTALVIVITGVYDPANFQATNPELASQLTEFITQKQGASLTSAAFGTVLSWFPTVLAISVFLFAYSTMISWSYYGEKAWDYLFGTSTIIVYRVLFVITCVIGSITNPTSVIDFTDATFLAMAFPNLLGCYLLSNKVAADLQDYQAYIQQKDQKINSGF